MQNSPSKTHAKTPAQRSPLVDAYLEKAAPFARPILAELRARVLRAAPAAQETLKWGHPAYTYQGKLLCGMAAFKQHASFGFWRPEAAQGHDQQALAAMGQFGCLVHLDQLPAKRAFTAMVKRALALIDDPAPAPRKPKRVRPPVQPSADLRAALARHAKARRNFEALSPSHQREYDEWICEAKREDTRLRRIATTLEWLTAGKSLNWKYEGR